MATYKVKPSDNYSKIAEQYQVPVSTLVKLNRQAPLSAGMTIKVPKSKGGFIGGSPLAVAPMQPGMDLQNPYNAIAPTPAPAFGKTRAPTVPAWGQMSAYEQGIATQQAAIRPLAQGSFVSGSGSVNLQGYQPAGGRGTILPTASDRINAQLSIPSVPQRPPAGSRYTGDPNNNPTDKAWVDYWNYQATLGDQHSAPVVMTKDQIWNMKAQQRRRRQQEAEQDDNNRQAQERGQVSTQIKYQPILSQAVTWNIG